MKKVCIFHRSFVDTHRLTYIHLVGITDMMCTSYGHNYSGRLLQIEHSDIIGTCILVINKLQFFIIIYYTICVFSVLWPTSYIERETSMDQVCMKRYKQRCYLGNASSQYIMNKALVVSRPSNMVSVHSTKKSRSYRSWVSINLMK